MRKLEKIDFSEALSMLRLDPMNRAIRRACWPTLEIVLCFVPGLAGIPEMPGFGPMLVKSEKFEDPRQGHKTFWTPCNDDLFASDWEMHEIDD